MLLPQHHLLVRRGGRRGRGRGRCSEGRRTRGWRRRLGYRRGGVSPPPSDPIGGGALRGHDLLKLLLQMMLMMTMMMLHLLLQLLLVLLFLPRHELIPGPLRRRRHGHRNGRRHSPHRAGGGERLRIVLAVVVHHVIDMMVAIVGRRDISYIIVVSIPRRRVRPTDGGSTSRGHGEGIVLDGRRRRRRRRAVGGGGVRTALTSAAVEHLLVRHGGGGGHCGSVPPRVEVELAGVHCVGDVVYVRTTAALSTASSS
mmetsp:Transcript_21040/g.50758  ORF Transcript_21040/g.50758 Transcript_21040/m.50758 type:complete len:255 (+) Transcript_21040:1875-2639(+)